MFYIVIAITCALLSGWIAEKKGRDWIPWFIGGLVFGPLGVLVVLIAPHTVICNFCRKGVDLKATVCPHCHRNIGSTKIIG